MLTEQFLKDQHETLKAGYPSEEGLQGDDCSTMAFHVARLLIEEGKEPFIVTFGEDDHSRAGWITTKRMQPVLYKGRLDWGAHHVCCEGLNAFDPLIGFPFPLSGYSREAFGENIRYELSFTTDEILLRQRLTPPSPTA